MSRQLPYTATRLGTVEKLGKLFTTLVVRRHADDRLIEVIAAWRPEWEGARVFACPVDEPEHSRCIGEVTVYGYMGEYLARRLTPLIERQLVAEYASHVSRGMGALVWPVMDRHELAASGRARGDDMAELTASVRAELKDRGLDFGADNLAALGDRRYMAAA